MKYVSQTMDFISYKDGRSLQVKYINSATTPTIINNDVSAWSDIVPAIESGKRTYMTQKMSDETNWSIPMQMSAEDGVTPTVTIDEATGNWVINGEISSIKAKGEDGDTPVITVGENGNWYVDGVDTGTQAQGPQGVDGNMIEYVYYRSETAPVSLDAPSYDASGNLSSGWTASPLGITEEYKYEYVSVRTKTDGTWSEFSTPVIWSKWGEKGQDGDGVSYKYYLTNSEGEYTYDASDANWTDEPTGVSEDNKYEYVVQIKTTTVNGETTSTPSGVALWAKWSSDGEDGVSVTGVVAQYCISTDKNTAPTSGWDADFDAVLETYYANKKANPSTAYYIWSREQVSYSSGNLTYSTATVNSASSFIASWCDENDQTKINGANIATGTLSASQITTGTLDADRIATDAIRSRNYSEYSLVEVDDPSFIQMLDNGVEDILAEADTNTIYYEQNQDSTYNYIKYDNGDWVPTFNVESLPMPDVISGSFLDLEDGTFNSKNFTIDADGNVNITGVVNAQAGTFGGWDITEDGIEKKDADGNLIVGMHSGNFNFTSMVDSEGVSSARFYAGGCTKPISTTIIIPSWSGGGETYSCSFPHHDLSGLYEVDENITYTVTNNFTYRCSRSVEPKGFTSVDGGINSYSYSASETITLGSINILSVTFLPNGSMDSYQYDEESGKLILRWGGSTSLSSTVFLSATITYSYKKTPMVETKWSDKLDKIPESISVSGFGADRGSGTMTCVATYKTMKSVALEDGSLYSGAAKITGEVMAESGKIGNLKIQNGGLEGYRGQDSSEALTFKLNSSGLVIPDDSAIVQVGDISLRQSDTHALFSAQGAVSLQAEGADGPVAYIRFGGTKASESDASNEAQIDVYAEATGTVANPGMRFYATSTKALPVARRIILYYNVATWAINYPTGASETTLIIQAGATRSDDYYITASWDVFDRYLRFSKNITEVKTPDILPRNFGSTETAAEVCMSSNNDMNSASIKYETFTWSNSSNNFLVNGNILLDEGKTGNLGSSESPWTAVFAESFAGDVAATGISYTDSGTVNGSDRNIKKDIETLPDVYGKVFDSLVPVRYKYKDGTSDRYHTGFIAQDVLGAVENAGLTSQDFAAYCAWEKADGESTSGLRYEEFIALCVDEIQKLKKRVEELEKEKNE